MKVSDGALDPMKEALRPRKPCAARLEHRAARGASRVVIIGVLSMALGVLLAYLSSEHAYLEGVYPICGSTCTVPPLHPLPMFSVAQVVALEIAALLPLIGILDSREPLRFASAVAALAVGVVAAANLLVPLVVLFPTFQQIVTTNSWATALVRPFILVIISGSLLTLHGLRRTVPTVGASRMRVGVSIALLFSLAFLCPVILVAVGPSSLYFAPVVGLIVFTAGVGTLYSGGLVTLGPGDFRPSSYYPPE